VIVFHTVVYVGLGQLSNDASVPVSAKMAFDIFQDFEKVLALNT